MIGSIGHLTLVVGDSDTAIAYGSGDVPVLATPRVLALAEQAAVMAIGGAVGLGKTSVGIYADLHHVKATAVGGVVAASAKLVAVDGRKLSFSFTVTEGDETVAHGTHERVVVSRDRF